MCKYVCVCMYVYAMVWRDEFAFMYDCHGGKRVCLYIHYVCMHVCMYVCMWDDSYSSSSTSSSSSWSSSSSSGMTSQVST